MPTRRLPNSAPTRLKAMQAAKERKDAVPPPVFVPLTAPTITRLDTFYPIYQGKVEGVETALQAQTQATALVKATRPDAEMLISHFYQALQNAITRGVFEPTVRAFYGLDANDSNVPVFNSEADIDFWGGKAAIGEAARIAAGGTAISLPAIAQVTTAVTNFNTSNNLQANAKEVYDAAQEAVEADLVEADKLILKMWNEIETAFDIGDAPSKRRKSREWGVVYTIGAGETPSPDEFSIIGTVTDSTTGNPINNAIVRVAEPDIFVLTDATGKYFTGVLSPGIYTLQTHKEGYTDSEITGVTVTAGAVTTQNIELTPSPTTGTISGVVTVGAGVQPATVSIDGTALSTTTDVAGNYTLLNVPAGPQVIRAIEIGNPANFQTQNITVVAGDVQQVNFNM